VTAVFSDLVYLAGPSAYFLYAFFPAELAYNLAVSRDVLVRLTGFSWAAQAVCWFLILRYGIRGLMDLQRPWRMIFFLVCFGVGLTGGFRSTILLTLLVFAAQFYFEGLVRTRFLIVFLAIGFLLAMVTVVFVDKMPLAVQRSLSFLPIKVDPGARRDAEGTLEWRLVIWRTVAPDVPKYLLLGKGYSYSGTDYVLTSEAIRRGIFPEYEETLVSGNYHSGILTLLIPFGAAGALAFIWFCGAGLVVLYRNYRYSSDALRRVNTFLLAYFVARLVFYVVFYGQFDLDLFVFTGLVGLSISLNAGVRTAEDFALEAEESSSPAGELAPGLAPVKV
jgi:hypothetical protein